MQAAWLDEYDTSTITISDLADSLTSASTNTPIYLTPKDVEMVERWLKSHNK